MNRKVPPVRTGSKRSRKAWLSVLYTTVSLVVVSGLAWFLQVQRDTDLTDPNAKVTSTFKESEAVKKSPIRFQEVAEDQGVRMRHGPGLRERILPEDTGSGIAWGDYDNDGDWDLYIVNYPTKGGDSGETGSNHLFRNEGGRFTDVTESAGVADRQGFGMGASFADYDNDGDSDLYVTNFGRNRLFRNQGDGTFEEVAEAAGVADPLWGAGVTWGDFDLDGHLDFYLCNYVNFDMMGFTPDIEGDSELGSYQIPFTLNPNAFDPQPNRLFRNLGDGTFEEVAAKFGVANPGGRSLGATFTDLDGDGWLDLYVNNDVSPNKLFRNMAGEMGGEGPLLFADISSFTGTADPRGSMGLSVGEIGAMTGDPDGLPDLFITHWVAQENAFYQSLMTPNGLEYRDKIRHFHIGELAIDMVGWGSALIDMDLDGWIDIAVANGSTLEQANDHRYLKAEPVFLFWNDGKVFHNVASVAGETVSGKHWGRGLAAADFDRDGDVDLAMAINRGEPLLLRNETRTDNHSLVVTLSGPDAVRFGAKVEVSVSLEGRVQTHWWGADVTFLGMHAAEMVFGLGKEQVAERVRVRWIDGRTTVLENVPAGRIILAYPDS